jgi:hypothetical protein
LVKPVVWNKYNSRQPGEHILFVPKQLFPEHRENINVPIKIIARTPHQLLNSSQHNYISLNINSSTKLTYLNKGVRPN